MVKSIFRGIRTVYEAGRFLLTVKRYGSDMSQALDQLPRLMGKYFRGHDAGFNLRPHLVFWFGRRQVENLITGNVPWLERLSNFMNMPYSPENNTLAYTMMSSGVVPGLNSFTLESYTHRFQVQRGNLTLRDGAHKIVHVPDFNRDEKIVTLFADDFWKFLVTIKFYDSDVDYVAIENCDPMISYISTCPCESVSINGVEYSLFATPPSLLTPILGAETLRA